MDPISRTSRQERVLDVVQANTLFVLDHPDSGTTWVHAGTIADKLNMDRSNVARELNNLYRDGQLIKVQGKPTLYICRSVLSRRYPGAFFPSTIPKGSSLQDYTHPQEPAAVPAPPDSGALTELETQIGVGGSMKTAVLHAKAAVMYPGHGLHTLVTGSVGVGKSQFVQKMHAHAVSKGALAQDAPLITVNCREHNASPRLLMNQIFGYSRDAAPKGEKSRRGLIERAAGGILCLNGIEKLPADVQDVLITLLEKNTYTRIGEASVNRQANVMVVGISTEPPDAPSMQGLSQRFPVLINIPALRDRSTGELAEMLIEIFQNESSATGLNFRISKEVFSCFLKATYPGNLGELSSAVKTTCSLVYLEYASTVPRPKIMEVSFRHLPSDVLRTIQEDARKDQQIRDLFNRNDFSYILFSPNGFSTDHFTGQQFLDLLHSSPGGEKDPSLLPAPLTIANEYLRYFLSKNAQNYVDHFSVLQDLFPESLLSVLRQVLTHHSEFTYLLNQPNGLYQLSACIQGGLQGRLPIIPNAPRLVQNLESICPDEMRVVRSLQRLLPDPQRVKFTDSVVCCTAACLNMTRRRNISGTIPVVLVCHGKDVAVNMAAYVNDALNATVVHGLCYPESMRLDELLDQVTDLARRIDQGSGILLMVDMAPLTELHEHILQSTGIHTETVANVSLPLLLSVCRRLTQEEVSLHDLAGDANAANAGAVSRKETSLLDRTINEVLAPSLTFINPQKTVDVLSTTLTQILHSRQLVWSTEIAIKFIFHCSHMLERLITGNPLRYDRLKQFVNQNSALMNVLEREMQYPSEVFGVTIPASELAYVAEIFLPYIS